MSSSASDPTLISSTAVSSSASDSAEAIVTSIGQIDDSVNDLQTDANNPPPMTDDTEDSLQEALNAVPPVDVSCSKVASDLADVANQWLPSLQELASNSSPDLEVARSYVSGLSSSLTSMSSDFQACENNTEALNAALGIAISQLKTTSSSFTSDEAGLQSEIDSLNDDISSLNKKISDDRKYESIGWVLGPMGYEMAEEIGDLADQVSEKQKDIESDTAAVEADEKQLSDLKNATSWCDSTSSTATKLSDEVSNLLIAIQALTTELNTAAAKTNPDNLFQSWLSAQLGDIISALQTLAEPSTAALVMAPRALPSSTSSFGAVEPSMADRADTVLSSSYTSGGLADAVGSITAQLMVLDAATTVVTQQQKLDLPLAPTVESDQGVLNTTCYNWKNEYRSTVLELIKSISSSANLLSRLTSTMLTLSSGDDLSLGLEKCYSTLQGLEEKAEDASDSISTDFIRLELEKDAARFSVTTVQVEREYKGTDGKLDEISSQISTLQTEIDAYNSELAKGATSAVVKALAAEIVFAVALGAGSVALPAAAAGSSELTVLLYTGSSATVKATSKVVQSEAKSQFEDAVGGESGEEDQEKRITDLRELVIEQGELESALVSYSVVTQQLSTIEASSDSLADALKTTIAQIESYLREIELLQVTVSVDSFDKSSVDMSLQELNTEFTNLESVCDNLVNSWKGSGLNVEEDTSTVTEEVNSTA